MLGHKVRNISLSCNRSMESLALSNLSNLEAWFCVGQGLEPGQRKKNWAALLIMLIVVITITGNILVIMAVTMERKLQNATNYFLMSLAVADMLLGFLVMPISMVTILYGYSWPLPAILCPLWIYLDVLLSTASIMHLCAISVDRYIAIRNPIAHSRAKSAWRARAKITAVWTISASISMPIPVLGLHDHTKVFKEESCFLTDSSFVLIGSFMAFFMPLTIMVVTYFLTINALHSEATLCLDNLVPRPRWNGSLALGFLPNEKKLFLRRSLTLSNEQKASKVLGIVFILFVVMWCPFFVTNVLVAVCDSTICHSDIISGLHNVFVWVGYLSSAVNPLVYTLFNKTYRSAFARYVRCQYREERKPLRLILVNTIPPLVYQSALAEALGGFSSPLPSKKSQLSKRIPQESVSCL
ncbi:5-hydroxytryptamine receptor 2A [Hemibagrus wyckioides]|uniref:5-hydroxytryptamine receptor 2A n=1 Tax=Hemibagrus wyckioides TaxID=337641 RepID=UPI00266D015C|nr:5-hydroxytryptamine receptor 2A [Hemibagrus wyckioides]